MSNPVSISHIEARFRALTDAETINAQAWLADAWALVLDRRPLIESYITAGTVSTASVIRVVSAMVVRVLQNPEGKLEESIDDYSYRRDSAVSGGQLYLTDDELNTLTPVDLTGSVRSVRLVAYGEPA